MALTDAISVAAKALGIGADVYWNENGTKYSKETQQPKIETVEDAASYALTFGKYSGKTLGELYRSDFGYLEWLYKSERTDPAIKKGIEILRQAAIRSAKRDENV